MLKTKKKNLCASCYNLCLFYLRSSGGVKGDSESEADPFVHTKTTNNIKYEIHLFYYLKIFSFNIIFIGMIN